MTVEVKICGITSTDAVSAAVTAGARYGGLVFHPASPRAVTLDQAAVLASHMRGSVKTVALVADANDMFLTVMTGLVRPDFLQLHGSETPARAVDIRQRFRIPVIKALPVADAADFDAVADYQDGADMLLFDAKPPKDAARSGGHGLAFDWTLLNGRNFTKPWFLAGGLNTDNVARAIAASGARRVDVSSGVESAPGIKDAGLITHFIKAAIA